MSGIFLYSAGTSPFPMSCRSAVFTGSVPKSTPIGVWSKGHCLLWRLSRQVLHAVWPQAKETGGFLIAWNREKKSGLFSFWFSLSYLEFILTNRTGKVFWPLRGLNWHFADYFLKILGFCIIPGHQADFNCYLIQTAELKPSQIEMNRAETNLD